MVNKTVSLMVVIVGLLTGCAGDTSIPPLMDGKGLLEKPAALSEAVSASLYQEGQKACGIDCVTPFGAVLGQSEGVESYSNCRSTCIKDSYSFLNLVDKSTSNHKSNPDDPKLHYIGLVYQCVEYARRWWMQNKGITFGDVDGASDIIYLDEVKDIYSNESFPLGRSINGSANRPPMVGDLLIYYAQVHLPTWRFGHVAVVVDVDLEQGFISVAEQNYNNKLWLKSDGYARKIKLVRQGKYYAVEEQNPAIDQGVIAGWVYPAN